METAQDPRETIALSFDPKDASENAIYAALSYVSVLSIVMLVLRKDSKFVQEHAKQGTVLFMMEIIVMVLGMAIPIIGWFIIAPIGHLLMLILSIIGFVKAIQGEFWEIPCIGKYRNRISL
jgi:uncharacterized membrane protein